MSEILATSPALPGEAPTVEGRLADIMSEPDCAIRVGDYRLSEADKARVIAALRGAAQAPSILDAALREAIDVFEGMNDDEIDVELLPRLRAALSSTEPRAPATIAELEAILNSEDDTPVTINPDGTVSPALPGTERGTP